MTVSFSYILPSLRCVCVACIHTRANPRSGTLVAPGGWPTPPSSSISQPTPHARTHAHTHVHTHAHTCFTRIAYTTCVSCASCLPCLCRAHCLHCLHCLLHKHYLYLCHSHASLVLSSIARAALDLPQTVAVTPRRSKTNGDCSTCVRTGLLENTALEAMDTKTTTRCVDCTCTGSLLQCSLSSHVDKLDRY